MWYWGVEAVIRLGVPEERVPLTVLHLIDEVLPPKNNIMLWDAWLW